MLKVLSLADGVGTGREVLKRLGIEVEYHAIEISPYKRVVADANHPDIIRPSNDIVDFADNIEFDHYDLILCGFTCTSLSSQGNRDAWEGDSKIFFDCVKIVEGVREVNPKVMFFFENVCSMENKYRDQISEILSVPHFRGESGLVAVQDRHRYYWFNWSHPVIEERYVDPRSVLDEDGLAIFSFSKSNRNKRGEKAVVEGRFKANGKAGTLVTGVGCKGQSTMNKVITKKMKVRDLTPSECARLQGLDNYVWPSCTDMQVYESCGEGWQATMVEEIFKQSPLMRYVK